MTIKFVYEGGGKGQPRAILYETQDDAGSESWTLWAGSHSKLRVVVGRIMALSHSTAPVLLNFQKLPSLISLPSLPTSPTSVLKAVPAGKGSDQSSSLPT